MNDSQIVVGTVQINNSFSGQSYFPYSVGILQAYAQKHLVHLQNYQFLSPVFKRISVEEAVERLLPADVVGFSSYVWNAQLSLRIAKRLKEEKPETLIVFGGPHVPNDAGQFLLDNPFVDVAVHGEGEKPFLAILENIKKEWRIAPSISFWENGQFFQTEKVERMRNLDEVPSPYLEGIFDGLMEENPKEQWIAVWETNRGCPFGCTFCDWGSNTNAKIGRWGIERLYAEFDWFASKKTWYVFCADANFGILPHDLDVAKYCVQVKQKTGYPFKLSVQNTKSTTRDAMEKSWSVQKVLSDGGLNQGVVVSMQSLHEPTLKAIKRDNMKQEYFEEIQRRFTDGGVETMSDLILGMPEETYDSFANGVSLLIERGQHNRIQFNNLSILPNAEMGDVEYQEKYGMRTVKSKIINIHGLRSYSDDDVDEIQDLVVETASMPAPDWVRTRVFCWMSALLHFDKVLQIPLVVAHELSGVSYRNLIELFSEGWFEDLDDFPVLREVRETFVEKARAIQKGDEEFSHSSRWLDIWWPTDELTLIMLCSEAKLSKFYEEVEKALQLFLKKMAVSFDYEFLCKVLEDAVRLNHSLMKLPFQDRNLEVKLSHNVWEFYQGVLKGKKVSLMEGEYSYHIDRTSETWNSWEEWAQKVIWWGNKRGAYLYGNVASQNISQLAGHF